MPEPQPARQPPRGRIRLKHRWSVSHNYLAGITAGDWWRLLRENGFAIDPPYWHRAAFVTAASVMNAWHRSREERRHGDAVARTALAGPPLFVLGHWRSGTTHLHNLLAQDQRRAVPNTYQVVNPHTFLVTEAVNTRRFAWMVPDRRPMDEMALSFDAPQEDEFAPCLMTGLSLYLGITFPRREAHYARYLTFAGVPDEERERWGRAFHRFLQKLTFKYQRPLVLKSPPHTARIRLLLDLFPDAKFVHIHRDPYRVFRSFQHYFDTATWYTYLQRPDPAAIDEGILSRYTALYDAFFADRPLVPAGRFHEVAFADLERDPVGEMARLYEALDLGEFDPARPALERYVASIAGYRKNAFDPLPAGVRRRVAAAWRRSFDVWRYPLDPL